MSNARTPAPVAPRKPHRITQHGLTREDPYFWLRFREDDPDVMRYLEAENAFTQERMAHTGPFRNALVEEMKGRMMEQDVSPPDYYHDRRTLYYYRNEPGKNYAIHCQREAGAAESAERTVLDENTLAEGHAFFKLGAFAPSSDHRLLAYTMDTSGDEQHTLRIRDLSTGADLPDTLSPVTSAAIWANDNRTLFYSTMDAAKRPYRVFRHRVGDDPANDTLVFEEPDTGYFVWIGVSADRRYLVISCYTFGTTEERVLPLSDPEQTPRVVRTRTKGVEYNFGHAGGRAFLVSNANDAVNFKLLYSDHFAGDDTEWRELVPHRPDAHLERLMLFKNHLVRLERAGGLPRLRVSGHDGQNPIDISFPEQSYYLHPMRNDVYDSPVVRIWYTSHITPGTFADIDLNTGAWTILKQTQVPSGYDHTRWQTARLWATAPDGAQVPISVVHAAGIASDGSHPMLLTGYGAYGINNDPYFDFKLLSLLERGFVVAIAHVRGGAEMGRAWYDNGKLLNKKNTFGDFIACAEHVIAQGYTRPDRLAIRGGSAGGLLMGAVLNMRPDLFAAAIADVPFVDVISTMSDPSIPLTVPEYEQWGNPENRDYFDYMMSYSPYDNMKPGRYPRLLVTTGLNDAAVQYWEPAKFVAKLRATLASDADILLKVNLTAGHGGASGRYDHLEEDALRFAFLIDRLGVPLT
jgi:oligopeptidase B